MSERELFREPVKDKDGFALIPDTWKIDFFASTGELSRFYLELKENGRLMGTRCPQCGSVYFWPRSWCHDCYVDCEWVEMPTRATLTAFNRIEIDISELHRQTPFYQSGVRLEGARYSIVAVLTPGDPAELRVGMPLRARFLPKEERTGRPTDFYFVPE